MTVALHDLSDGSSQNLPPLLFSHATGFHGMIFAPVAAELADVAHCWAIDLRGHGDSTMPASASLAWQGMADDVLAVVDHLGGGPVRAVGHSMGGTALLLAEQARPGTFSALWCYEPIVFPPFDRVVPRSNPLAQAARRRKAVFPSRDVAMSNYMAKAPLNGFVPAALEAYVTYGFREHPDGSVELKCAPETEAQVFENGSNHDAFAHLDEVACPVTVVQSGDGAPPAQIAGLVADALPHGQLEDFPQYSHFGPMEDPLAIAKALRSALF